VWGGRGLARRARPFPTLSSGENSMNRPPVSQFVTTEHLGEIRRQVQETVIQIVCGKIKVLERHYLCGG